uniref:F-box domain-containing protein n=1 Tax=Triticum urartu TaxID=4572 RepID=A0A8R7R9V1_TRIUA
CLCRSSSSPHSGTAAERLTDDLLVEILSRVPAKSLCRFKCVSNHWLNLIDHSDHRKKLPQTLAGFFYTSSRTEFILESPVRFVSVPGSHCPLIDTTFAYLPKHEHIYILDCCNGLLLYGLYAQEISCIVCNPATKKWVTLPNSGQAAEQVIDTRLGFDPAKSPHFHVFEFVEQEGDWTSDLAGVAVYSSETGRWVYREKKWN